MAIIFEKKGKIAYITINRPEALNAIDPETAEELSKAMIEYRDDDNLRAAILTGAGDKAFCAGADIKKLLPFVAEMIEKGKEGVMPPTTMRGLDLWKPIIAAINGIAFGGGLELAISCDLIIVSEKATFGFPEVGLGSVPGWGGTTRLIRFVPRCKAAEILLLGRPIDAQEAYRIGLVNKVVPAEELMPAAEEWADRLCEVGPLAVRVIKELLTWGGGLPLDEALRLEWKLVAPLQLSEDVKEATRAFTEKRKPEFRGK